MQSFNCRKIPTQLNLFYSGCHNHMLVFISYPREYGAVAEALDAELRSRNVDTFLDKEKIAPSDVWQLKIESNIKKADIFVVLYLPEAATRERFFLTETERIKTAYGNDSRKKLITVIFSPTTPKDLPAYFRTHQILIADAIGLDEDEKDGYWINQVVQEVQRLKEKIKLKWRQVIARTALAIGVTVIVLLYNERTTKIEQLQEEIERLQKEIERSQKDERSQKPFEGEWKYRSQYEKYYDEPKPHELYGGGSAIVLWKYSKNRYEVKLSYSIHRLDNRNPLLVNVFKGEFRADTNGWPMQQPFVMNNEILHRLHYQNKVQNLPAYQFKDCTYIKNTSGDRPETIDCILETPHSRSKVTFIREADLH